MTNFLLNVKVKGSLLILIASVEYLIVVYYSFYTRGSKVEKHEIRLKFLLLNR